MAVSLPGDFGGSEGMHQAAAASGAGGNRPRAPRDLMGSRR